MKIKHARLEKIEFVPYVLVKGCSEAVKVPGQKRWLIYHNLLKFVEIMHKYLKNKNRKIRRKNLRSIGLRPN